VKVLHVAPYTDSVYGGPGVAIRAMAQALVGLGAEVDVATTNAAGSKNLQLEDGAELVESGVRFKYFDRTFPRGWFRAPGMGRWLNAHAGEYDLLHLHVPFTAPFRAGAMAARAAGRPYVVTTHGVLDPWSLAQRAWKKQPYLRYLERDVLAGAAVLHVTAALEQGFMDAMRLGPPVRCLPLAVPLAEATLRHPLPDDPLRVLCIARLHPVKALPVLFDALAQLRADGLNVVLDLAGEGDAGYVAQLRQQAKSLGLEDSITWHGYVDAVHKERLYAAADCFALLSHHENFGLAAAEAMAAGVPVVVSDQVGLAPDVLECQAGCVVPVNDEVAASQALRSMLKPELKRSVGARARDLVQQRYSATSFADGLGALYEYAFSRRYNLCHE